MSVRAPAMPSDSQVLLAVCLHGNVLSGRDIDQVNKAKTKSSIPATREGERQREGGREREAEQEGHEDAAVFTTASLCVTGRRVRGKWAERLKARHLQTNKDSSHRVDRVGKLRPRPGCMRAKVRKRPRKWKRALCENAPKWKPLLTNWSPTRQQDSFRRPTVNCRHLEGAGKKSSTTTLANLGNVKWL